MTKRKYALGGFSVELRPTRKDPEGKLTRLAIDQLEDTRATRQRYDDLLQACLSVLRDRNEDPGPLIAGIYSDKFSDQTKVELRTLAHNIGSQVDMAFRFWAQAGRRDLSLIRRFNEEAHKLRDGRVSYY